MGSAQAPYLPCEYSTCFGFRQSPVALVFSGFGWSDPDLPTCGVKVEGNHTLRMA